MSPDDSDCCVFVPEQHPHDLVSVGRYAIQKSERNLASQSETIHHERVCLEYHGIGRHEAPLLTLRTVEQVVGKVVMLVVTVYERVKAAGINEDPSQAFGL